MSMYTPAEDMAQFADMMDMPPMEEPPEQAPIQQEEVEQVAEAAQGIRRRLPMLVVASVALGTAAAAALVVQRRVAQRRGARRWLPTSRRTSLLSPRLFVMLPLSAYVQVVNRNASQRRFRLMRKRLASMARRPDALAKQVEQLSALRERVPVGKK